MKRFAVLSLLVLPLLLFASCSGSSKTIEVKGAEPITEEEIDAWTKRSLASYNFDMSYLTRSLPPLDPPQFRRCRAFVSRQTYNLGSVSAIDKPMARCQRDYATLKKSVVNTLIISRWARSKDNPLRAPSRKKFAVKTINLELESTFPDKRDQAGFLKATDLNRAVLNQRRAMDLEIIDYFRQSAGNFQQPSLRDLDKIVKSDPRLRGLPVAKARSQASKIWTREKRGDSQNSYDVGKIRQVTRCGDNITSALCGNRPAAGRADVASIVPAQPLVPKSASPLTANDEYLIAVAEGFVKRYQPRDLGNASPLPYSDFDTSPSLEVTGRDGSTR